MAGEQHPLSPSTFPPLSSWVRAASPGTLAAVAPRRAGSGAAAAGGGRAGPAAAAAAVGGRVPLAPPHPPPLPPLQVRRRWWQGRGDPFPPPVRSGRRGGQGPPPPVGPSPLRALLRPLWLWRMCFPRGLPVRRTLPANPPVAGRRLDPHPVVDQPPPPPVAQQGYTVAALTAARAEHAARQARLREAALVWEREREATDAIAAQIATAEQLLASPAAHDGGATSSDTVGGVYGVPTAPTVGTGPRTIPTVIWHDPADSLVAQLHLQAGSVQNIRLMVPVVLEPESPSYARWRDLLLLTLRRYALDDHVLCDPTDVAPSAAWVRLDNIVLT
jgi:hypothetical protein